MKIRILSDLHLEFGPLNLNEKDEDVVVLAGDIVIGAAYKVAKRFPNKTVIIINGNHEYYGRKYEEVLAKCQEQNKKTGNVFFLENGTVEIKGVVFAGATLWSDAGNNPVDHIYYRKAMNDYAIITYKGRKLGPEDTTKLHRETVLWLQTLKHVDVVVTHYLPSFKSISPQFTNSLLNPLFATNLDPLIKTLNPKLWIHGHTHDSLDYFIGNTRIVCNPRGYYPNDLNNKFNPELVIEI